MPFAVVLILLVVGSIVFHVLSPWTFTELASNWGMVDFTVDITLYVTGFVSTHVGIIDRSTEKQLLIDSSLD